MVIATKVIDIDKIVKLSSDYDALCEYIKGLVPKDFKHVDAIYHNTRYYINITILKSDAISLEKKNILSNMLTRNIRVVGYMDRYVTCDELAMHVNTERVIKYYEGDRHEKV